MSLRDRIALALLVTALLLGLSPVRILPFSDFPLYAYVLPEPTILTLMIVASSGDRRILSQRMIRPMTRIHLNQMLKMLRNDGVDLGPALAWILNRVRALDPRAQSVEVVRLTLGPSNEGKQHFSIEEIETLYVIPLK
jgi:hypothetical protein